MIAELIMDGASFIALRGSRSLSRERVPIKSLLSETSFKSTSMVEF